MVETYKRQDKIWVYQHFGSGQQVELVTFPHTCVFSQNLDNGDSHNGIAILMEAL